MVSPRRTVDVENRRDLAEGLQSNVLNIKNQNMLKPPSVPLVDVRNTLAAARQLFKNANESAKPSKDPELKPLKPLTTPVPAAKTIEVHEPDTVWDAPLAWEANVEDDYHDIIPRYLQLSDKDWDRIAWNCPGPRTGSPLSQSDDDNDVFNVSIQSFEDLLLDALDCFSCSYADDELMDVPPPDDSDDEDAGSLTDSSSCYTPTMESHLILR